MAQEFKTVVTVLGQLSDGGARPFVSPGLEVKAGSTPETVTVVHPRTKRLSQLFLFEYDLLQLLFDGAAAMPDLLLRMQGLGHSVTYDQLASWIHEMARTGSIEGTLGIEPSRRMVALPWRGSPEPAVVTANWPTDARQRMSRALALFREGHLSGALTLLRSLVEHPQAAPAARRLLELCVLASGVAPGAAAIALAPAMAATAPAAGSVPLEQNGFDDEGDGDGDWVAEATQVLNREDLMAAQLLVPVAEPILSPAARATLQRWARAGSMLLVALLTAWVVPLPLTLRYPCAVEPLATTSVRASLPASITEIVVEEGALVQAGDVVARQNDKEQQAALARLAAERDAAKAALRLLQLGSRDELIGRLASRVTALSRAYGVTEERKRTLRADVAKGSAPRSTLESLGLEATSLLAELKGARAELELARAGARTEDIEKAEADLTAIDAELHLQQRLVAGAALVAPARGLVMTRNPKDLVGEHFNPGEPVLVIGDVGRMRLSVFVEEEDFDLLTLEQPIEARLSAFPQLQITTTTTRIAPEVQMRGEHRVVRVEGLIENEGGVIAAGMTGYAALDAGWEPLFMMAARRVLRFVRMTLLV